MLKLIINKERLSTHFYENQPFNGLPNSLVVKVEILQWLEAGRAIRRKEPGRLTDCKEHCSPAKLGSTLTSKLSCEKEINMRKGQFVPLYFLVSVKTASPFPSLIYSH